MKDMFTALLTVAAILLGWGGVVLFVQLELQYAFIAMPFPLVRALHVLNGTLMLVVTTVLLLRRLPWNKTWQAKPAAGPA